MSSGTGGRTNAAANGKSSLSVNNKPLRLTPAGLVLLPLSIACVITGVAVLAVSLNDRLTIAAPGPLITATILVYSALLVLISRTAIAKIRELESVGLLDSLTRLPNRRALHEDVERLSAGDDEVALALIDLDAFKQVNDHYGHAMGDRLIARCAEMLSEVCGNEARCYRLGGDEFAAVMGGKVAGTILEGICRTLIERLSVPVAMEGRHIPVGASIGLARSTADHRLTSSELLRRSDVAMYMSKRGGKMRCTWFNESFDRRRERVREIEDDIRTGIAAGEFALAYQPLVDAEHGRIVAVEALLRWDRGERDPLGPNVFIPIAEDSGLINPLGQWVLRQAVCDALAWDGITLSVNISAAQLRNPEFPIRLGEVLEETGFPPHRLELEVTETCLVLDPVVAERTLDVIRSFGVRIALDDFGTGYASIGFLRRFRFEKLKLDRSLIELAGGDDSSRAMMLSSIALARALDMGVTAEGVETEEQAELVRLAGCDQIQGWLYYRALPAREVDRLIAEQGRGDRADEEAA
ncbi:MAG: EAL domain-containing protein [Porphyrobacter sp.]|nr:EAL domain-containing protein [Porphyrobacter sp.]